MFSIGTSLTDEKLHLEGFGIMFQKQKWGVTLFMLPEYHNPFQHISQSRVSSQSIPELRYSAFVSVF